MSHLHLLKRLRKTAKCVESIYLSISIHFSMIMNPCELYYPSATSSLFIIRVVRTNSEEVEGGLNMA